MVKIERIKKADSYLKDNHPTTELGKYKIKEEKLAILKENIQNGKDKILSFHTKMNFRKSASELTEEETLILENLLEKLIEYYVNIRNEIINYNTTYNPKEENKEPANMENEMLKELQSFISNELAIIINTLSDSNEYQNKTALKIEDLLGVLIIGIAAIDMNLIYKTVAAIIAILEIIMIRRNHKKISQLADNETLRKLDIIANEIESLVEEDNYEGSYNLNKIKQKVLVK